jgi:Uncharacterized protein conserved in bacteria (DUF2252)
MASDLAGSPQSGIRVQRCGDAHLANFGAFASPERQLLFDLNDFDETLPGPWEWDVKRLAASVAVVGRENGFAAKRRTAMVRELVDEYRRAFERSPGSFRRRKRRARYSSLSPPSLGSRIRGSVCGRGTAPDAVGQRHLPRMVAPATWSRGLRAARSLPIRMSATAPRSSMP